MKGFYEARTFLENLGFKFQQVVTFPSTYDVSFPKHEGNHIERLSCNEIVMFALRRLMPTTG